MDSAYLKTHVGKALVFGLSEICQKKPRDPIDYLSKWLMKYVENMEYEKQIIVDQQELAKEQAVVHEEERRRKAMEEEQNQIADELLKLESENSSAQPEVTEFNVPLSNKETADGETTDVVIETPNTPTVEINEVIDEIPPKPSTALSVSDTIAEEEDEEEELGGDEIADSLDIN